MVVKKHFPSVHGYADDVCVVSFRLRLDCTVSFLNAERPSTTIFV